MPTGSDLGRGLFLRQRITQGEQRGVGVRLARFLRLQTGQLSFGPGVAVTASHAQQCQAAHGIALFQGHDGLPVGAGFGLYAAGEGGEDNTDEQAVGADFRRHGNVLQWRSGMCIKMAAELAPVNRLLNCSPYIIQRDDIMRPLVLASTSPFRRALLQRLGLPFDTASPGSDESPLPGETPQALVVRLAEAKARAVAAAFPRHLIIGSDQVALLDDEVLGKPGDHARATAQLAAASGRTVRFLTGLCLLNSESGRTQTCSEPFDVQFRPLSKAQIEAYLRAEQPYNCAGSFKSEGLGIALFERLQGDDPNALIGLPLIRLVSMLAEEGVDVLLDAADEAH